MKDFIDTLADSIPWWTASAILAGSVLSAVLSPLRTFTGILLIISVSVFFGTTATPLLILGLEHIINTTLPPSVGNGLSGILSIFGYNIVVALRDHTNQGVAVLFGIDTKKKDEEKK